MAKDVLRQIPRVDLADFRSPTKSHREAFAETVEKGLRDIGFIFVYTPHIARRLPEDYEAFAEGFALPQEALSRYERPDLHYLRGYTPLDAETALACQGRNGKPSRPDHRAGWLIGPESISDPTLRERYPAHYAENIIPEEVPKFQERAVGLHRELDNVGKAILQALEPRLGYEEGFFEEVTTDANTVLRPLNYPPVDAEDAPNTVWGCRHTDGNLVSVLPPSKGKGLKVKIRGGEWIEGIAPAEHTIVQVGDMLQYMTGGYLTSAVHRIDVPEGGTTENRYSAPLFIYPRGDVDLKPDENLWEANPLKYRSQTAVEFFENRLRKLGLAKDTAAPAPPPSN